MHRVQQILFDEIARLPLDKVGKALSFVRYLENETEPELLLDPYEETELRGLLKSGDFVGSQDVLARIKALPDD